MNTTDPTTLDVVIYHNPQCGTSRNTLALIRNTGVEPHVIEYLKTPPERVLLTRLASRMAMPLRGLLRQSGTPFAALRLDRGDLTDDDLFEAVAAHPILINRPIVVTPWGVRLCRPAQTVLEILPLAHRGPFVKEDGEMIIGADGHLIDTVKGRVGP